MNTVIDEPLSSTTAVLARQPILDRNQNILGYELLYRHNRQAEHAEFDDPDAASASVMLRACTDFGLERLVGGDLAFINMTSKLLRMGVPLLAPDDRLVLEILETETIDQPLIQAVKDLKNQGFRIALDDFEGILETPEQHELLQLLDFIKLDIQLVPPRELEGLVKKLRSVSAQLIAEKVETPDQYQFCKDLNLDGFQGYYLFRPEITEEEIIGESRIGIMQLMAAVEAPDAGPNELAEAIRNDAVLTYKLLRLVNSAFFGLRTQVRSIQHAIVYLGMSRVRQWARMLAIARLDDQSPALMKTSLNRAHVCELLAADSDSEQKEQAFIVGLFSLLDVLIKAPMEKILENLPVAEPIRVALLRGEGPWARALKDLRHYERGEWELIHPQRVDAIAKVYIEALQWTDEVFATIHSD